MVSEQEILSSILISTLPSFLDIKNLMCWSPLIKGEFRSTYEGGVLEY